jgi:hypothetical protein
VKYFGVTQPITLAGPTPQDKKNTDELEKTLRGFNLFEPNEESRRREEVLGKLNVIVKEWVRQVSLKKVCQAIKSANVVRDFLTYWQRKLGQRFSLLDPIVWEYTALELILILFVWRHGTWKGLTSLAVYLICCQKIQK